jgi:hypothetical protein
MKFFNILLGRGNAAVIGSGARPCAPPPAHRPKHQFIGLTPLTPLFL